MPNEIIVSADGHDVSLAPQEHAGIDMPNLGYGALPMREAPGPAALVNPGLGAVLAKAATSHYSIPGGDMAWGAGVSVVFAAVCIGLAVKRLSGARRRMGLEAPSRHAIEESWLPADTPENRAAFLTRYERPF